MLSFYARRNCPNSTTTAWSGPYNFHTECLGPISGVFTINKNLPQSATNFLSFTDAAAKLNAYGINGPVTFDVSADTYTESITIYEVTGSSATNTITFNGVDSVSTILTDNGANQNAVIELLGTDYITFKNMKIANTKSSNYAWGINFTSKADNVTISNCLVEVEPYGTGALYKAAILGNGSGASIFTGGDFGNNTTITGNVISGGLSALKLIGPSGSFVDSNAVISGNVFKSSGDALALTSLVNTTVTNNIFDDTIRTAMYLNDLEGFQIENNTVFSTSTAISLSDGNAIGLVAGYSTIKNNVIVSSSNEVESTTRYASAGISLDDSRFINVYHNSVTNVSTNTSATYVGLSFKDIISDVNVKNNIFAMQGGRTFFAEEVITNPTVDIDYNCYYNTSGAIAEIDVTTYSTLALWQAADASRNVNTVFGDPVYTSTTNLLPTAALVNNTGDSLNVLTDIDGNSRSLQFPDMGAYEFALPCSASSSALVSNITLSSGDLTWTSGSGTTFNIEYDVTGFTQGTGNFVKAVANPYTLSGLAPATTYDFYIQDSCGTEGTSIWVGPFTFTTLTPTICNVSTSLGAFNITTGSAKIFWTTGGAANWNVEYGLTNFTQGNGTMIYDTPNDTIALTGLVGGTCYDFYVQDSCGSTLLSTWAGPFTFCTSGCLSAGQDSSLVYCENFTGGINVENALGKHDNTGVWDYGTAAGAMVGNQFFPSVSGPGTFELIYKIDTIGCPADSSIISILIEQVPNAGPDVTDTICDTSSIYLASLLGPHTFGGTGVDADVSGALTDSILDASMISVKNTTYRFWYQAFTQTCGNDVAILTLYVDECGIGLSENSLANDVHVYPNPGFDVVNISFNPAGNQTATIRIYSSEGKEVFRKVESNLNGIYSGAIDISNLSKGVYMMEVNYGDQKLVKKLIKA